MLKKQIVVIHGGTSFKTYKDYITYLKTKEIDIEKLKSRKDWKNSLESELGKGYEILRPRMPNATNARYKEWKIWFERIAEVLSDGLILIGHSLGGIFLAKYLSENTFPKRIDVAILVAAPFDDVDNTGHHDSLIDFTLPPSLKKFSQQAGKIYLLYSKDDPVVSLSQLVKYQHKLPDAKALIFKNKGHFIDQKTFPELIKIIKSITSE